jgi:NAD(P)-dependent dehydrogenase (short-subunit alcohol dehydrogenase family)
MAEVDRFAKEIEKREKKIDILVNNAGASWGETFDKFPEEGWDKVIDLNLKSVFFLSQRLVKLLEAAASAEDCARIINIGSIDGLHVSGIETYSYAASKAGVMHMTRMMAKYLAPRKIAVNAIAPGFFPSNMTATLPFEAIAKATPLKRAGRPEDMAGVALYLSSKASGFVCGAVIPVDGGYATTV